MNLWPEPPRPFRGGVGKENSKVTQHFLFTISTTGRGGSLPLFWKPITHIFLENRYSLLWGGVGHSGNSPKASSTFGALYASQTALLNPRQDITEYKARLDKLQAEKDIQETELLSLKRVIEMKQRELDEQKKRCACVGPGAFASVLWAGSVVCGVYFCVSLCECETPNYNSLGGYYLPPPGDP